MPGAAVRRPSSRSASRRSIAGWPKARSRLAADTIVTMYHSCHRALAGAEAAYPLRVVNFTDILAEALGRGGHPDYYRLYKAGGPMDEAGRGGAPASCRTWRQGRRSVGPIADRRHLQRDRALPVRRESFQQAFTRWYGDE